MEEAFRALLLANAGFAALINAEGVAFGDAPQNRTYPLVVMMTVSGAEGHTMKGPDGLFQGRVQVDCLAVTARQAKLLARAAVTALNGHRSSAGSGARFLGIFHDSTRDGREGGTNEADRPFRTSLDFLVNWRTS